MTDKYEDNVAEEHLHDLHVVTTGPGPTGYEKIEMNGLPLMGAEKVSVDFTNKGAHFTVRCCFQPVTVRAKGQASFEIVHPQTGERHRVKAIVLEDGTVREL